MKRAKQVRTTIGEISFRVDVEWPDADVDVVIAQRTTFHDGHKVKTRTPTADSVDRFLDELANDEELRDRDIRICETCSLMMGGCFAVFEVDGDRIGQLQELVDIAVKVMKRTRAKHVRYHRPNERSKT